MSYQVKDEVITAIGAYDVESLNESCGVGRAAKVVGK
jgi:hypothetical protein